ncbi:MAG: hypothetical protein CVU51_03675 [Deltaproteobacteria bacterium HGW-Deltaproteobacteria-1]|jgi:uncharacterized protein|nr:MAG: hypothetical protein CVU51_03675 [Deltaproteobacteria bacterium HGW-Deltaproteobacteria-1]
MALRTKNTATSFPALCSDALVREIVEQILSATPDVPLLLNRLQTELHQPAAAASRILYDVVRQVNSSLFPPVTKLELMLSEGCNLACSYCFEKSALRKRRMSGHIARAAIDLLFDYARDHSSLKITHFGGEPTLNFEVLSEATRYAEQKAAAVGKTVSFHMTSNGVGFTREMISFLADHHIMVLLSIDGLARTHDRFRVDRRGRGTFDLVMETVRNLKVRQPWIGAKMTVMPGAVDDLYDNVVGLYNLGVNQFVIGHATGVKWSVAEIEYLHAQLCRIRQWYEGRKHQHDLRIAEFENEPVKDHGNYFGCQAAQTGISTAANGEISACSKVITLKPDEVIGKLGDVDHGLTHIHSRLEMTGCQTLRANCEAEGIADDFRGGCFACNYEEHKDLFKPNLQEYVFSNLFKAVREGKPFRQGASKGC